MIYRLLNHQTGRRFIYRAGRVLQTITKKSFYVVYSSPLQLAVARIKNWLV